MDEAPASHARREILTPSGLNRLARDLIENALPLVWVEGELSNCARPASGHLYFTLKDAHAQVRCAMFRTRAMHLRFKPADGAHVLLRAKVSLYEGRGEFQLVVEHMEEAGEGALRREFERLKGKLSAEGMFEPERKRALPRFARRIGVITSATGAAVRDVLSVLRRRFPLVEVEVLPVAVQGAEAPAQIVTMLRRAGASGRYDVLLLARGGGSLEDLMAFNDEALARGIARCPVPVVSAVGHEIDFTIADFVADLRAPTPSAAAELLVPHRDELRQVLARLEQRMRTIARRALRERTQRVDLAAARLQSLRPSQRLAALRSRAQQAAPRLQRAALQLIAARRERLRTLRARFDMRHPARQAASLRERLVRIDAALALLLARRIRTGRSQLVALARALHAVGPLATIERGYAILRSSDGRIVRSIAQVSRGDALAARVADGEFPIEVTGPGTPRQA